MKLQNSNDSIPWLGQSEISLAHQESFLAAIDNFYTDRYFSFLQCSDPIKQTAAA